jgi:UDP-N-acetyl-D-glucosamine dehydrogenase
MMNFSTAQRTNTNMSRTPLTASANERSTVDRREAQRLLDCIESREATVGVIGLGCVGLPLAVEYAGAGFETIGIDMDGDRADRLNAGKATSTT